MSPSSEPAACNPAPIGPPVALPVSREWDFPCGCSRARRPKERTASRGPAGGSRRMTWSCGWQAVGSEAAAQPPSGRGPLPDDGEGPGVWPGPRQYVCVSRRVKACHLIHEPES